MALKKRKEGEEETVSKRCRAKKPGDVKSVNEIDEDKATDPSIAKDEVLDVKAFMEANLAANVINAGIMTDQSFCFLNHFCFLFNQLRHHSRLHRAISEDDS